MPEDGIIFSHAKNASETTWLCIWGMMVSDGTAERVFVDGTVRSSGDFLREMQSVHVHPYIIYHGGKPAALLWLTNLEGKSARGHFVVFREHWKKARHLVRFALEQVLTYTYDEGGYCFDVIIGMIPMRNKIAINTCVKSGFRQVGTIPHGAWIAEEARSEDMILLAATREDIL